MSDEIGSAVAGAVNHAVFADRAALRDAPVLLGASFRPPLLDSFDGYRFQVSNLTSYDRIVLLGEGTGAGQIGVSGDSVTYGGVVIGSFAGGEGDSFTLTFNASASAAAVEAAVARMGYQLNGSGAEAHALQMDLLTPDGTALYERSPWQSIGDLPDNPFAGIDLGETPRIAIGDINGDGLVDLVSAGSIGLHWVPYQDLPDDTTNPIYRFDEETGTFWGASEDTADPPTRIYLNDGQGGYVYSGSFTVDMHDGEDRSIALADADGDGDLDIFYVDANGLDHTDYQIKLALNDGHGNFTNLGAVSPISSPLLPSVHILSIAVGDVSGNGTLVALMGTDYDLNLFQGSGTSWTGLSWTVPSTNVLDSAGIPSGVRYPALVDFDGDGDLDLYMTVDGTAYAATNTGDIHFARTNANYDPFAFLNGSGGAGYADFYDLNGDGRQDLIISRNSAIEVYWNTSASGVASTTTGASFALDFDFPATAPQGADATITMSEDVPYALALADFGFADEDGDGFAAVTITTVPAHGALTLDGVPVTAGQSIAATDIAAGSLMFTPAADENGASYASFTFQVQDDSGADDLDPTPNTLTFDVTPVADAIDLDLSHRAVDIALTGSGTAAPVLIDAGLHFASQLSVANGQLSISGLGADDRISILGQGDGAGQVGVSGSSIRYGGVEVATVSGGDGDTLMIQFNGSATAAAVQAIAARLAYATGATNVADHALTIDFQTAQITGGFVSSQSLGVTDPFAGFTAGDGPGLLSQMRFGDIDGDGDLDIIATGRYQPGTHFADLLAGGSATGGGTTPPSGFRYRFLGITDAEGVQHVYWTDPSGGAAITVWKNDGVGNFSIAPAPPSYTIPSVGADLVDWDGDGDLDLVFQDDLGSDDARIFASLNDGTGQFGTIFEIVGSQDTPVFVDAWQGVSLRAAGDFDGDGTVDLLITRQSTMIYTVEGGSYVAQSYVQGNGVRQEQGPFPGGSDVRYATVDINGDGRLDIVGWSPGGAINYWQNTGPRTAPDSHPNYSDTYYNFGFTQQFGSANPFSGITAGESGAPGFGDFDGDGDMDMVLVRGGHAYTYWNTSAAPQGVSQQIELSFSGGTPEGADATITLNEDSPHVLTVADFGFHDAGGASLAAVVVATVPAYGSLTLDGVAVSAGQSIAAADIAAGRLVFTPATNENGAGYANLSFQVQSDSPGGAIDGTPNTLTFDVTPVADAIDLDLSHRAVDVMVNGGGTVAPVFIDTGIHFASQLSIADATLTISGLGAADRVAVLTEGDGAGQVGVSGTSIRYGGVEVATFRGGEGGTLTIQFNASASAAAVEAVAARLAYTTSDGDVASHALSVSFAIHPPAGWVAPALLGFVDPLAGFTGGDGAGTLDQLRFADVDGDGDLDVVAVGRYQPGANAHIYTPPEPILAPENTALFQPIPDPTAPYGVRILVVTADAGPNVTIWRNDGLGNYSFMGVPDARPNVGISVDLADIDGDGDVDMVMGQLSDTPGIVYAMLNDGTGAFGTSFAITSGYFDEPTQTTTVSAGDIDGDGVPDILNTLRSSVVVVQTADGWQATSTRLGSGVHIDAGQIGAAGQTALVDIDGDGDLDVLIWDSGQLRFFLNTGSTNVPPGSGDRYNDFNFVELTGSANPFAGVMLDGGGAPSFADLDGDGDMDLVVVRNGQAYTYFNSADPPQALTREITINIVQAPEFTAPTGTDATLTLAEDGSRVLTLADFGFQDLDGDGFAGIAVAALPGAGLLTLNGVAVQSGAAVSAADIAAGRLVFTPAANANGAGYAGFDFRVFDTSDTGAESTNRITFNVTAVNDAPVVSIAASGLAGGETLVNTFTPSSQEQASIASFADGGYVVAWHGIDQQSGSGIFFQRYDAAGTRQGGEVRANSVTANDQIHASVTALDGGGFVVSWMSFNQDGNGFGIYAQRYDGAGVAQGGEFRVNTYTNSEQAYPAVAALSGGGFVVSWQSYGQDVSAYGVYAQRYDGAGVVQGGEFRVNSYLNSDQSYPVVTGLAGGGFVVAWMSNGQDGDGYGIYAQRYDASGATVGGEVHVSTQVLSGQEYPAIASLSDGGFVVTWMSYDQDGNGYGIYGQRYDASGAAAGGEFRVNTTIPSEQVYPSVAGLAAGGFVVTWQSYGQDGSDYGIYAQRYDAAGATMGGETQINTTTIGYQGYPAIAGTPGGYVVAWHGEGPGDAAGVFVQRTSFGLAAVEQTDLSLKGMISVNDIDAGSGVMRLTLSVDYGLLTLGTGTSGATIVSGNGTSTVVVSGTLAQLQALLGSDATSSITYFANTNSPPESATLTVTANDQGNTGGAALTGSATATITITDTFDTLPTGADATLTLDEDGSHALTVANFGFSDADGDGLAAVVIVTLPGAGVLTLDGAAVEAGQSVSAADIAAGRLVFTPVADANGASYASFDFRVVDSSGAEAEGNNRITFDVTAVNDAPTASSDSYSVDENTVLTVGAGSGLLQNDSDPDSDSLAAWLTSGPAHGSLMLNPDGTFVYVPEANFSGTDSFTYRANDGSLFSAPTTVTITVNAVDTPPVAVADLATTTERAAVTINVLGNDTDIDGGPMGVVQINGAAIAVGGTVTIASGATVTLNANGTLTYNPNGRFDYLVSAVTAAATGAGNSSAVDSFTYALNGGAAAAVAVTVTGLNGAGDQLRGSAGNDILTSPGIASLFMLDAGGDDRATGGTGDDGFFFGTALDANDRIDGGAGTDNQVAIQGNYLNAGRLVLGASSFANVQTLSILSGSITRFGGTGSSLYSYDITMADGNVTPGATMTINANTLLAGENLSFNGAAETHGSFFVYAGRGDDVIVGGQNSDGFFFGTDGRFTAADQVDGQGGADDQLSLRGDYSSLVVFGATTMTNIETLVLMSASDVRFAPAGTAFSYNLQLDDANVAAGRTLTVSANALQAGESVTFDGSNEHDGAFVFMMGRGNDVLIGGDGNDRFYGRDGQDVMTGGAGNDTFYFRALSESTTTAMDHITDFATGDLIDVSYLDANTTRSGNQAFTFIGDAAFTNTAGQLRVSGDGTDWVVEVDVNGDGVADMAIHVTTPDAHSFVAGDFIL